jgi:hypothetical protein
MAHGNKTLTHAQFRLSTAPQVSQRVRERAFVGRECPTLWAQPQGTQRPLSFLPEISVNSVAMLSLAHSFGHSRGDCACSASKAPMVSRDH